MASQWLPFFRMKAMTVLPQMRKWHLTRPRLYVTVCSYMLAARGLPSQRPFILLVIRTSKRPVMTPKGQAPSYVFVLMH